MKRSKLDNFTKIQINKEKFNTSVTKVHSYQTLKSYLRYIRFQFFLSLCLIIIKNAKK